MLREIFINTSYYLYVICSILSLCVMIIIDYHLGEKAEFLNAWAVVVKILELDINVPYSFLMKRLGLVNSLLVVIIANSIIGILVGKIIKIIINKILI